MTVSGVNNSMGVTKLQPVKPEEPVASIPIQQFEEPKKSSNTVAKTILTLATLGAVTYGIIKYRNAKALKPILEKTENATKNGGKMITELTKSKVKNPDSTTSEQVIKSVKTLYDKEGKKVSEIIFDVKKGERYTVVFDKDGNVTKNVISRMSIPVKGEKPRLQQNLTYVFTRNGNEVTTSSRLVDYSGKKPVEIAKSVRKDVVTNNSLPVKINTPGA